MNIFAGTGQTVERYEELLVNAKKSAERQTNQGRAPPRDKGVKYSIEHDVSNTPYVVIDADILNGVPKSKWVVTVKNALAKKFPNGVHVGNNVVKINKQSRLEMTYSQYTQWLAKNDEQTYADKFRAANNANEIILASRAYINEGLKHARKDNIRDFARGTVLLRIGNNDYSAEVVVGTTSMGDMLLYDIVNLQKTQIKEKSKHTVPPTEKASSRSGVPTSATNIPTTNENVNNKKFSLELEDKKRRDAEYMDAVKNGDEIEAQELVDEAANAAGFVYKRNSRSKTPLKGSTLMQFLKADNNEAVQGYGQYQFAAHGNGAINVDDVETHKCRLS